MICNLVEVYQLKASSSPYSETSPNANRTITDSTKGHGVIVRIGWRVVVPILALNCMHAYASNSAGNASCCKNRCIATAADYQVTVGWYAVAEATANFYSVCNHIPIRLQGRERCRKAANSDNMSICTHVLPNHQYKTKKGTKAHHKGIENQKH